MSMEAETFIKNWVHKLGGQETIRIQPPPFDLLQRTNAYTQVWTRTIYGTQNLKN